MPSNRLRRLVASKIGNEPERFQFLADRDSGSSWLHQVFTIDLRSLAALRMVMGLILIVQVLGQSSNVDLLFSDQGIMSRSLNHQYTGDGYWSLFWINGTGNFAQMLFVLTGLAAALFVLGFQTRVVNLVCLLLLWSIQVRDPLILTGGGILLRMLFFWSMFLPMGAMWSIDASRSEERPTHWSVSSIASAAILLQVVYMYFFTGLAKLNPFWISGDAIEYALNLEMSVKPLGEWLKSWPGVLRAMTFAIPIAEILTLPIMFLPRLYQFNRGALMGFFWLMHIGIWLTMSIGLFSITAMAAWIIFIPSEIWNSLVGEPGFHDSKSSSEGSNWLSRLTQIVCGFFLTYITLQNVVFALDSKTTQRFSSLQRIGEATMTIQKFQMFAEPPLFSPWFEYTARLESGELADLFTHKHKSPGQKPGSVYGYLNTQTWRRLHWNLITHPLYPPETELVFREIRRRLLLQMVQRWDADHLDDPVFEAELKCHLEPIVISRNPDSESSPYNNHENHDLLWATYEKSESSAD